MTDWVEVAEKLEGYARKYEQEAAAHRARGNKSAAETSEQLAAQKWSEAKAARDCI
ncbi:hypothetical protein [Palleronia caenipelagi]|uniref:hypothetical protein n=1 Tax=Palleronia caenipelagi TaxID=2489174 RepID=UPI00163D3F43|nr:hypothetical protein [Palleronia caenipelagi]